MRQLRFHLLSTQTLRSGWLARDEVQPRRPAYVGGTFAAEPCPGVDLDIVLEAGLVQFAQPPLECHVVKHHAEIVFEIDAHSPPVAASAQSLPAAVGANLPRKADRVPHDA